MNLNVNNLKTSFAALLAGAALSTQVFAETNAPVSTPIVGFQTKTINTGLNSLGLPLLKADTLKTTVTSVSGANVTLNGETNFGSKLNSAKKYYLEVYSGNLKGDRFDIDTAASISSASSVAVLNASGESNTLPIGSIGSNLDNAQISIREHITIQDVEGMLASGQNFVGAASLTASDQISFVESGALVTYTKRSDGTWKKIGSSADFGTKIIPPGVGVIIKKTGTPVTVTQTGAVRENDFARPYTAGLNLMASGFPLDRTPANVGVSAGTGASDWTGGTVATGDQIRVVESGALVSYTLKSDNSLNKIGSSSNFRNTSLINGVDSQLIRRAKANSDNIEVNPLASN